MRDGGLRRRELPRTGRESYDGRIPDGLKMECLIDVLWLRLRLRARWQ